MNVLENHINGSNLPNFTARSSSLSSYATFNDSESSPILRPVCSPSGAKSWLSQVDLGCPVCQHEFCFSSLLCTTENVQGQLPENSEKVIHDLHARLHAVSLECTVLRSELEVLHKAFTSKCEAVKILTLNNSNSSEESDRQRNTVYASTIELKKETERLKIQLELSKGALVSQCQSFEAKIQQLQMENENLMRQLENLQLKTGQLLEENMHLLQRNTSLSCTPSCEESVVGSLEDMNSDKISEIYLDENSLQKLADQDAPLTSEAVLYLLQNQSKPCLNERQIPVPVMKTTLKKTPESQNKFQSFFSRLRSSGSDKMLQSYKQQTVKPTFTEKESQCDFIPFAYRSPNIREISVPLKCMCNKEAEVACKCARTAVGIQRQLLKCKCELSELTKRFKEIELSEDAYRHALREQYQKNINMSIQLSEILPYTPTESLQSQNYTPSSSTMKNSSSSSKKHQPVVSNPSTTESLNNLLTWFHKILDTTATSMKSLSSSLGSLPFDENKEDYDYRQYSCSKHESQKDETSLNEPYLHCYEKNPNFYTISKSYEGSQNEQITLSVKRKISKRSQRINQNFMPTQLEDTSSSDRHTTPKNGTPQIDGESVSQNPIVYQRKISRSSSRHAKRLKSRCRSVDYGTFPQVKKDENINTMLLHQLLLLMNEVANLIVKQKLVCDHKRSCRSSSALS
ncbi:unnamed protein product [Heterobilharzia americana]|nr:unnamed protein product [Heterobilharzia americana]